MATGFNTVTYGATMDDPASTHDNPLPQIPNPNATFIFQFASVGFTATAEYEGSGRILVGYNLKFRGSCILTENTQALLKARLDSMNAAMSVERNRLQIKSAGTIIWDISGQGGGGALEDRRWGPKPRVVDIRQITGGLSARVTFEIDTFVLLCTASGAGFPVVEEFWWVYDYSFDESFKCTRTISGQYRVASPINAAEQFLGQGGFWPKLPDGFKRTAMNHHLSSDGCIITFSTTDKEQWRTLPQPLTNGHASFTLTANGPRTTKSLNCSFEAPVDVNKRIIIDYITTLIRARFPMAFTLNGSSVFEYITHFSVTSQEFENRVDCSVTSIVGAITPLVSGSGTSNTNFVFPPLTQLGWGDISDVVPLADGVGWTASNGKSELRGMLGTAGILPVPQPIFDPCRSTLNDAFSDAYRSDFITGPSSSNPTPPRYPTTAAPGSGGTSQNDYTSAYPYAFSVEQASNPYISFCECITYCMDHGRVMVPIQSTNTANLAMRAYQPQLRIIQIGHATRIGIPPLYPQPSTIGNGDGVNYISKEEKRVCEPKFLMDGATVEYGIDWCYEILAPEIKQIVSDIESTGNTFVRTPINPQFSSAQQSAKRAIILPRQDDIDEDGLYRNDPDMP